MRTKIFWCFDFEEIWNINDNVGVMGKSGLLSKLSLYFTAVAGMSPSCGVAGDSAFTTQLLVS